TRGPANRYSAVCDTGIRINGNPRAAHEKKAATRAAQCRAHGSLGEGSAGAGHHQISYCTPASVRDNLPPWPKLVAFAAAAAAFQFARVTNRRSSGRSKKSGPTESVG